MLSRTRYNAKMLLSAWPIAAQVQKSAPKTGERRDPLIPDSFMYNKNNYCYDNNHNGSYYQILNNIVYVLCRSSFHIRKNGSGSQSSSFVKYFQSQCSLLWILAWMTCQYIANVRLKVKVNFVTAWQKCM